MAKVEKIVIRAEGNNDELIWKVIYPNCIGEVDVIVPETRECIVYKDGQMLETMLAGRHSINVPNYNRGIGVFRKIIDEPFECKVYFVKKGGIKRVDWGTPTRMKIIDPFCEYPISIGLNGSFNVTINNSRKFVSKLVGDNVSFDTDRLMDELSFAFVGEVKGLLARAMRDNNVGSYDLDANLSLLSREIGGYVRDMFDEYGVYVDKFVISSAYIPEEDRAELEQIMKQKSLLKAQDMSFKEHRAEQSKETDRAADIAYKFASLNADVAKEVAANKGKEKTTVVVQGGFCPQCGASVHNGDAFCGKCGIKLN